MLAIKLKKNKKKKKENMANLYDLIKDKIEQKLSWIFKITKNKRRQ